MAINLCHLERQVFVGLPILYQRILINIVPCTNATNSETILGYAQGNVRPMVEINGFEPLTPCLQGRCSSQLSYTPKTHNLKFNQSNYADVMILQTPLSLLSSQRYESILCIMAAIAGYAPTPQESNSCIILLD